MPDGIIMFVSPKDIVSYDKHTKDITTVVFDKAKCSLPTKSATKNNSPTLDLTKVFIVHGRDDLAKTETARFIEKLGFTAVILHEQVNSGKTVIEKIEAHTNVGFAIVLYTPCDTGSLAGEHTQKSRARQNVVFEHGYLIGKLGRHNVCALVKGDIEIPNDISGVVYIPFDDHSAWHLSVAKELRNAGYSVDMNKII
ncbi:nucleotide-binding protein [Salmonella enterica]|nr:nucleotide-binding protein [Salmonella enterica]EJJ9918340.1 nucleotide-binding protein [Salmonella enterica]EKB1545258.1 nucleotide-binding protein [Salmonella enterica]EKR1611233.1 nucleotide-binding protein [Salmonella enterica subsp. enterica serovar Muenchen]